MDDRGLEQALAGMRRPVKGVPFPSIVRALAQRQVIPVDATNAADRDLLEKLLQAIRLCAAELRSNPIVRPRPNEVGNDVELYVLRALPKVGLRAERPTSEGGKGKSTGYPDLLIRDATKRITYLECKIFTGESARTTMRSFYLSPSESFKVTADARHILVAFEMSASPVPGSQNSAYLPTSYKLIDLHGLRCDVKFEFNSNNLRLYAASMILSEGSV